MKKIVLVVCLLFVMSIPCVCQELAQKYCNVRMTIMEPAVSVENLCLKLSEISGAKLIPAEDWRVKERQVTVFCHDAFLPHIMYSIADITKFAWVVKDENTYVLTYRNDTDKLINNVQSLGAEAKANRGAVMVDNMGSYFSDDTEKNAMREKAPAAYLMKSTGAGEIIGDALKASPNLYKSIASGENRVFSGSEISQETLDGIQNLNSLILGIANDVCSSRNTQVPKRLTRILSRNVSAGNVEIEVNGDIPLGKNRKLSADEINNVCSGYALVRTNGVITGILPIINTESQITNKLAEAAIDMIENPGKSFDEIFASMDVRALTRALADSNENDNVYKTDIPYDPAMMNIISLGKVPESLADALMLFEACVGVPVFCDCYPAYALTRSQAETAGNRVLRQGTIYDVLTSLCDAYNLNVSYVNGQFDFCDVKWFDKIKNTVSSDVVGKWAAEYKNTNYLCLDTLLEMGRYTPAQLSAAMKSHKELKKTADSIINSANLLEMLSCCDGTSLQNMMTADGTKSGYLTKSAFEKYRSMYQVAGFSGRTPCRIKMYSAVENKTLIYTVEFVPNDGAAAVKIDIKIPSFN